MPNAHTPIEVFCSYAQEDQIWLGKLETHFSLLKSQGLISTWHNRLVLPGTNREEDIDSHLNSASVILLLISADFLASDYCTGTEMTRALERHQAHEAYVVPILLRPVHRKGAPFEHLQVLPTNAKPITTWSNQDDAFADVTEGIRGLLENLRITLREEPQGGEEETPFEDRKIALIVGVNNTRRSSLLPDLKYAEDDAHEQDLAAIPVIQQDRPLITRRRMLVSGTALAAGAVIWLIISSQNPPKPTLTLQALYNQTVGTTPHMDASLSGPDNFGWDNDTGQGGNTHCFFSQGQLHSVANPGYFSPCYAEFTNYQDFVLQVKMTLISGHAGGLVFRANSTKDKGYQFRISTDGTYILNRIILDQQGNIQADRETIASGMSEFVQKGANQTNQLGVMAQGNTISIFINGKYIDSATDSTYHSGQVGVYVDSDAGTVEGAFSHLQVWKLPVNHAKG